MEHEAAHRSNTIRARRVSLYVAIVDRGTYAPSPRIKMFSLFSDIVVRGRPVRACRLPFKLVCLLVWVGCLVGAREVRSSLDRTAGTGRRPEESTDRPRTEIPITSTWYAPSRATSSTNDHQTTTMSSTLMSSPDCLRIAKIEVSTSSFPTCLWANSEFIKVFRVLPRWLFVRVETTTNQAHPNPIVGWGEGTLEGHTEAVEGAFQDLRERFVGWDVDGIEDIWQVAYRGRFYRGGEVLMVSMLLNVPQCKPSITHSSMASSPLYPALTLHSGTSRARSSAYRYILF